VYLFNTISKRIYGEAAAVTSNQPEVIFDAKTQSLIDNLNKQFAQSQSYRGSDCPRHLLQIKSRLINSNVPEEHPTLKKIDEALLRHPRLNFNVKSALNPTPVAAQEGVLPEVKDIPIINHKFCEKLPLDLIKKLIQERGSDLQELDLYHADDELLALIVKYCPHLTALRLRELLPFIWDNFTDAGVESLANLKDLKVLELNCWSAIYVTEKGFETLLAAPSIQAGINEITIYHPYLSAVALALISQFKNLKSLEFEAGWLTTKDLEKLFQSTTLKNTLEKINFTTNNSDNLWISDGILTSLSAYKTIKELSLGRDWKVQEQNFLRFLESQKNLSHLSLRGIEINSAAAEKIGNMPSLHYTFPMAQSSL
jgi:hypothetical protein